MSEFCDEEEVCVAEGVKPHDIRILDRPMAFINRYGLSTPRWSAAFVSMQERERPTLRVLLVRLTGPPQLHPFVISTISTVLCVKQEGALPTFLSWILMFLPVQASSQLDVS